MEYSEVHSLGMLLLQQYGAIALFGLLVLGIVAFPVPEETMMMAAGVFVHTGHLQPVSTIFACYLGSMAGISLSYTLGRQTDRHFMRKYGSYAGLDPALWKKLHSYFKTYGAWMLVFGYFVPGVRHFTGFLVGVSRLEWRRFMLFAYSGAVLWVTTFLSIGYFLGEGWVRAIAAEKYILVDTLVTLALFYGLYTIFKKILVK